MIYNMNLKILNLMVVNLKIVNLLWTAWSLEEAPKNVNHYEDCHKPSMVRTILALSMAQQDPRW